MARFISLDELGQALTQTDAQISDIAKDIMNLEPFLNGRAVIFGAVAWGTHSSRSDIYIAHNYPRHDSPIPYLT